jgi:photosystem II protein
VANARSPAAAAAAAASSTTTQRKAPLAGFELGWTRDNEVFLSRLSMLGFAGTAVGEYLSVTGAGPLAQLGYLSGLEQGQVGLFLAGLIGFNLLASVLPNSGTFNKAGAGSAAAEDGAVGPLQDPTITLLQPAKFFSVTNWGFTPQNELFAGRVSLLGWVAALLGEVVTGLGPVGQLSAGACVCVLGVVLDVISAGCCRTGA